MARVKIAEIPSKMTSYWDDQYNCIIDCWLDFHTVTLDDVKEVLVGRTIPFVRQKACDIHVVDNSKAEGAFSREVTEFFQKEIAEEMAKTKVHYFLTVTSQHSPTANISMRNLTDDSTKESYYWIESSNFAEGMDFIQKLRTERRVAR